MRRKRYFNTCVQFIFVFVIHVTSLLMTLSAVYTCSRGVVQFAYEYNCALFSYACCSCYLVFHFLLREKCVAPFSSHLFFYIVECFLNFYEENMLSLLNLIFKCFNFEMSKKKVTIFNYPMLIIKVKE